MRARPPIAATLAALAVAGCGAQTTAETTGAETTAATRAAFAVDREAARADRGAAAAAARRGRWKTARVLRRTTLRARPAGRVVARIGTRTEFGSARVLAVTGRRGSWLRVVASERPNGRPGWIRARAVRLGATDVWLRVDRSRRRLTLRRGRRVLRRVRVAVGRPDTPTPTGRFAVTDRLRSQRADSPYGCCAIALSGHQTRLLPGWPGGDRLAIHGTPQPETIGRAVSLGCMRASARHMRALMRRVPLGAPVFVVA
jgi:lipoprotein-anchoring transpeptidase ErfK/SrfK